MLSYIQESTGSAISLKRPPFIYHAQLPRTTGELKPLISWPNQTIVSQDVSEIERIWTVTGASTVSVPQTDMFYLDQLNALQQWYVLRGERVEILRFLETYPFLVPLLVEAYYNIEKYFPYSLVFLTVVTDPEELGMEQLVAFISTDLGPDEATDALSNFDKKWWRNSLKRAQGKLCITLEFK